MKKSLQLFFLFLILIILNLATQSKVAFAYESSELLGGKYQMRIGFSAEPAYEGLENGLVTVCEGSCLSNPNGSGNLTNGVAGLFETLKAEVTFGARTMPLQTAYRPPSHS